jgi:hypothetical protein
MLSRGSVASTTAPLNLCRSRIGRAPSRRASDCALIGHPCAEAITGIDLRPTEMRVLAPPERDERAPRPMRGSRSQRTDDQQERRWRLLLRDEGGTLGRLLCAGLATPEAQGRPDSVRFGSGNPHGLPVNAGYCGGPARVRKRLVCSVIRCGAGGAGTACHAEGRGFGTLPPLSKRPGVLRRHAPDRDDRDDDGGTGRCVSMRPVTPGTLPSCGRRRPSRRSRAA